MYEKLGIHIAALLRRHDCVVVPTFGAFIAQYKSSELNLTTGKLTPPSKMLAFNPELRHNDALLISALAQAESYSYSEAEHEIVEFVKAWQEDINLQGIVSLKNVGRFVADVNGRLHFLPEGHNYNNDVFGMPVLTVTPVVKINFSPETAPKIQLEKDVEDTRPSAPLRPLRKWKNTVNIGWQEIATAAVTLLVVVTVGWKLVSSDRESNTMATAVKRISGQNMPKPPPETTTSEASIFPINTQTTQEKVVAEEHKEAKSLVNQQPSSEKEKPSEQPKVVKMVAVVPVKTPASPPKANVIPDKNSKNEPVEAFTIALGSFKSPVNVEMLTTKAKEHGDIVTTRPGNKGLTVVSMTVQLHRSELPEKLQAIRNIYGQNAVLLKK